MSSIDPVRHSGTPNDPESLRKAKRLLKELLPFAQAKFRKSDGIEMQGLSPIGQSTTAHYVIENIDAVFVYPALIDGWHADLRLKTVPPGIPNIVGTPVGQPCATRKEAIETAVSMLQVAMTNSRSRKAAKRKKNEDVRVFELHGFSLKIPGMIVDELSRMASNTDLLRKTDAEVRSRIDETVQSLFGGVPTEEVFKAFEKEQWVQLHTVLVIALLNGVFRHPRLPDGLPGNEEMSPASVAERFGLKLDQDEAGNLAAKPPRTRWKDRKK